MSAKNFDFDDEASPEVDLSYKAKSPAELKDSLPTFPKEALCEIVVCDRYFGGKKELAIMCMEELARRRIAGDVFDFESYIEKSFSELPKLNIKPPDLASVLRQFVVKKVGR